MKGKKKLVLPLLLAGVTATTGYVAPVTQAVSAATTTTTEYNDETKVVGEQIKIKQFKDTYSIGEYVYMPSITTSSDTSEVKYSVTKVGKKVTLSKVTQAELDEGKHTGHAVGDEYFEAKYEGYYDIKITAAGDDQVETVIEKLSVYVNKNEASIVLPVNSKYVIPAKVQKNETGLIIPAPSVLIGDNEEPTAYKDLTEGELKVFIYTPSGEEIAIEPKKNDDNTLYLDEVGQACFEVKTHEVKSDDDEDADPEIKPILSEAGTYTIVYKYYEGNSEMPITTLDTNFQVVNTYDTSKMDLTMTLQDSMPTSGNINEEVSIPKVKVTESATSLDAINAHVTVTITNRTTTHPVTNFDYETYTFIPEELGDYVVSYEADINVFGKSSKKIKAGTTIKVTDKSGASVMPTYGYDLDSTDPNKVVINGESLEGKELEEVMLNAEHMLPSAVVLKDDGNGNKVAKVSVPAIYGTDNYDKLSEIEFWREYKDPSSNYTVIDVEGKRTTGAEGSIVNQVQEVELTKAGTYTFKFWSWDRAKNTKGYKEYSVQVYDSETADELEDGEATLELDIPYSYVSDKDKTLTFSAPTATDTFDKYIKVVTEYELYASEDATGDPIATSKKELTSKDKNSSGKYSIDIQKLINDYSSAKSIKVTAKAYLDGSLLGTRTAFTGTDVKTENGFIVLESSKVVKVINSKEDQESAELAIVGGSDWNKALVNINKDNTELTGGMYGYTEGSAYTINDKGFVVMGENDKSPFDQNGGIIKLPAVKFTDKDDNLSVSVSVKNAYGNAITLESNAKVVRSKGEGDKYVYTVDGISFQLSNYGIYTITYTAEDVGGNITVQTFGVRVNDKTAPSIKVDEDDKFSDTVEVGEKFIVPTAKLTKGGKDFEAKEITWEIVNPTTTNYKKDSTGFTAFEEGTFEIVYKAIDIHDNSAELGNGSFIVSVKDTTAPVLELNDTFVESRTWSTDKDKDYQTITIPSANAWDSYAGSNVTIKVSVSGPNSTTPTLTVSKDDDSNELYSNSYSFQAKYQGVYTVTYTATDLAGNKTTETKELRLGDCEKPELTWVNGDDSIPTTAKLNEVFTVALSGEIDLSDNVTDSDTLAENLTVSLVNPSGSVVSEADGSTDAKKAWKIDSTGTYTLKFVVKDEAGNSETYSYKIEVPSEDVEDEKISPVVGTILVVVAVAVLAGVVVYFVVSSKKKTPASSKKTRKTNK